ncbi:MAG: DUF4398 domain-containing protein [Myxococcota bacterium]
MPTSSRRLLQLLSVATLAVGVGCGPFGYLKKVAKDASRAVADAEAVEAETYAPYEYWGAVSYLEQAKILMAYSEYERSFDYGTRAKQLAEEAKLKAERREAGKMKETMGEGEDGGDAAPAADASGDAKASGSAGGGEAKGEVKVGGSIGGGR